MLPERMSVSPGDYVVLDVETNGLRSKEHDLLSISVYKPDDGKEYDRFLPLDLNDSVETTEINGITGGDLRGKKPLTQEEVDWLFDEFDIANRTVLHYGGLDDRFIREYFSRHGLLGYERMHFFNFKQLICSTGYSDGSLTKDNLCAAFGIDGVQEVHSGLNDCKLEWRLFEAIGGCCVLARMQAFEWSFNVLSPDYIVPVSYLGTYKNLSRIYERPYIRAEWDESYRLEVPADLVTRFTSNLSGITIEWLIDVMLGAEKQDNRAFLRKNAAKNKWIGRMGHNTHPVFYEQRPDGTVKLLRDEDKVLEKELNSTILELKERLLPLIGYIKSDVFNNERVLAQELVVHDDMNIMALCDFSSRDAVLEIKTASWDAKRYAEQLYYEANGRDAYILTVDWDDEYVDFVIGSVKTYPGEKPDGRRDSAIKAIKKKLECSAVQLVSYQGSTKPIEVECKVCHHKWKESYARIRSGRCICPECYPQAASRPKAKSTRKKMTPQQSLAKRAARYAGKVRERSGGLLKIDEDSYVGGNKRVIVNCLQCGRAWNPRADHLLERCYCPECRRG